MFVRTIFPIKLAIKLHVARRKDSKKRRVRERGNELKRVYLMPP